MAEMRSAVYGLLVLAFKGCVEDILSILRMRLVSWHECVMGSVRTEGDYRGWSPHPARSSPTFLGG